ncbi:MAG: long-chain-fatty-acid--CoA ligase [Alphaproteobacteria bacterium]
MKVTQLATRAAQTNGKFLATDCAGRQRTWTETASRVARLGTGLRALGVKAGDRIAILALNSDRYFEYFFGVAWAGAAFVPLNTRLAPPEMAYWLADSGSSILFVDNEFVPVLPKLLPELPGLRHLIFMGDGTAQAGMIGYEDLVARSATEPEVPRNDDDMAAIFYTGGTTGKSKGVMLSHRNLLTNCFDVVPILKMTEHTRYLHAAPSFHIADASTGFAVSMAGGSHVFIPRFDPLQVLDSIKDRGVNTLFLVPTMLNQIVNHPDVGKYDLAKLDRVYYGASPMPEAVVRRTMQVMPHVELTQLYGQSETSPCLTYNPPEYHAVEGPRAGKLKAAGRAVYAADLAILDDAGKEVPRGTVGEVCVKSPLVMLGYWNKPEQTAQALRDGWLHTGDGGYMDEDGFIFIVDRMKDMIVTGAENVYSVEVENAVYQHPAVAECAVIGVPDDKWGERVHAIVRLKPGASATEAAIVAHCKTLIAGFKCPRSIEIRMEPLPVSGAGKILKTELRKPYWQGRDRLVN